MSKQKDKCPECKGRGKDYGVGGFDSDFADCPACNGTGEKPDKLVKGIEKVFANVAGLEPSEHKNVLGDKWKFINSMATFIRDREAERRGRYIDAWHWQDDGEDHLESLTCPVLIEAPELSALIEEAKKQGEKKALRRILRESKYLSPFELMSSIKQALKEEK